MQEQHAPSDPKNQKSTENNHNFGNTLDYDGNAKDLTTYLNAIKFLLNSDLSVLRAKFMTTYTKKYHLETTIL